MDDCCRAKETSVSSRDERHVPLGAYKNLCFTIPGKFALSLSVQDVSVDSKEFPSPLNSVGVTHLFGEVKDSEANNSTQCDFTGWLVQLHQQPRRDAVKGMPVNVTLDL